MPGFLVTNLPNAKADGGQLKVKKHMEVGTYQFFQTGLDKFQDDKVFQRTEKLVFVIEGCLYNKEELFRKYRCGSMFQLAVCMYDNGKNETFYKEFIGPFCGVLYDVEKEKLIAFTNQTGEKAVFYCVHSSIVVLSTDLAAVYRVCAAVGVPLHVDEEAIYQLATFAFLANDVCPAREVRRLAGGGTCA